MGGTYDNLWGGPSPVGVDGNIAEDPGYLQTALADPLDWDLHLDPASLLVGAGYPTLTNPDGTPDTSGSTAGLRPTPGIWTATARPCGGTSVRTTPRWIRRRAGTATTATRR